MQLMKYLIFVDNYLKDEIKKNGNELSEELCIQDVVGIINTIVNTVPSLVITEEIIEKMK